MSALFLSPQVGNAQLAAPTASSPPPLSDSARGGLTLPDALREARANNLEINAARRSVDVARAMETQAVPAPLEAQAASGSTQDVPAGLGTLQTFSIGASQQLSASTPALHQAAAAAVAVAQGQSDATERDVEQRVVTSYFALASAQAVLSANLQSVANAQSIEDSAQLRARVGAVGSFEVLRAQVELRRAQTDVLRASAAVRNAAVNLDLLLGRSLDASPTVVLIPASPQVVDLNALFNRAELIDPLLAQFRASVDQAVAQARAARLQRIPSLGVSGGYLFQRAPKTAAISRGPTAAITLSFPVLDYGTINGAVREAQARAAVADAQIRGRDAQLHGELSKEAFDIESAQARLSFSRVSLTQAQEGLRLAQFGYQKGALGVLDVLSARSELSAARSEVTQASADLGAAIARLQLTVGAPV
ncbi:MAG: TolC family protein [Candidatus Eremiobacteraeota bacterium]|nr:TolC family protein [Candidatus Eremiobacteraeota bacterium]